jgi:hypothetical protein
MQQVGVRDFFVNFFVLFFLATGSRASGDAVLALAISFQVLSLLTLLAQQYKY